MPVSVRMLSCGGVHVGCARLNVFVCMRVRVYVRCNMFVLMCSFVCVRVDLAMWVCSFGCARWDGFVCMHSC